MKVSRVLLIAAVIIALSGTPSFAVTVTLQGFMDAGDGGITSARSGWGELAEVENHASDSRITASGSLSVFNVGPWPWNSGIWLYGAPGYVQTQFASPSDSLFVQFEADRNDGPANFYIDGALEYSLNTYDGGWFAVIFSGLPWQAHTLRVTATSSSYPRDVAIDVMGSGAPGAPVPEPATLVLLGSGLAGVALARRRKRA